MNNEINSDIKRITEFKDYVLKMEKASLSNITKVDDKQMVAKIIRAYEEYLKNAN